MPEAQGMAKVKRRSTERRRCGQCGRKLRVNARERLLCRKCQLINQREGILRAWRRRRLGY